MTRMRLRRLVAANDNHSPQKATKRLILIFILSAAAGIAAFSVWGG